MPTIGNAVHSQLEALAKDGDEVAEAILDDPEIVETKPLPVKPDNDPDKFYPQHNRRSRRRAGQHGGFTPSRTTTARRAKSLDLVEAERAVRLGARRIELARKRLGGES